MKTRLLIIMFSVALFYNAEAQIASTYKDTITDTKTLKKDNLLDMQTNVLSSVFGENLDGNSEKKAIGFMELLDKIHLSPEQKTEFRNLYYLQAKDMTQKTKDSLSNVLSKKILEAKKNNK